MKLWKIFRFEFACQIRSLTTWLYLSVLLIFTLLMGFLITPNDGVFENNTFHITAISVMGGFLWLIMGAVVAGEAASRDVQTRMHPLTYSTAITKFDYLTGRFLAALLVNAVLMLSVPIGVWISFYLPGIEHAELQPFELWPYLSVFFLIAFPNAFIATALQFAIAALTRKVLTAFVASLLLAFFAQIIGSAAAQLFGNWDLVKLLDSVGVVGIIANDLGTWTPSEKNVRLVKLEGMFLWNRIMWISIALGSLIYAYFRFSFLQPETSGKSRWFALRRMKTDEAVIEIATAASDAIRVSEVRQMFGPVANFHQALYIARRSFFQIAKNPAGLTLVTVIAFISAAFGDRIMTQFDIPQIPTTALVLDYFTAPVGDLATPWAIIPLLIIYFAGELIWREREARISDIADATSVTDYVLLSGKFLGLSLIVFVWMLLLVLGGMTMQAGLGYFNFEPGLYFQVLSMQLMEYLIFATLAFAIHVVINRKYLGYLINVLLLAFIGFPSTFLMEHPMLIFGSSPGWSYTDMRGFGSSLFPWFSYSIYWTSWALLLLISANLLWPRGRETGFKFRLLTAKHRFNRGSLRIAIVGLIFLITAAGFIYYQTNIAADYLTASDVNNQKAEYEKRYGQYRNILQPQLTATKLQVDLLPDDQRVFIRGEYTLINETDHEIKTIHFGNISETPVSGIAIDRPNKMVVSDNQLSHYIYALEKPLSPGDSLKLTFAIDYIQSGFRHGKSNDLIANNGSSFSNYDLLPSIGYRSHREIKDNVSRKKHDLAKRPTLASLNDMEARKKTLVSDKGILEATISTSIDETAVAPGKLLRTWTAAGRRYFHYKTDAAIGGEYSVLSGKYSVQEHQWNDVFIKIYHYPGHSQNVGWMLRCVSESLEHYTKEFGPYPHKRITLVERAGNGGGASADASIIYYGEQFSLLDADTSPGGFHLPYYILAHEIAHQWWGLARLTPANVEGAGVLIEGLAVYSGMQVLEKHYGKSHLRKYVSYLHSSYESPRSLASPSLIRADQSFLYYKKGGLAMHSLSRYIGQRKVNAALRTLLEKRKSDEILYPTTLDLYRELKKVTPKSYDYLLRDLFTTNTYWRLKTKHFTTSQNKLGTWDATMKVYAEKFTVDSAGNETIVPMDDWLEIGIYEQGKDYDEPLYLKMHRITTGDTTIKLTLSRKPDRGGIDPNFLMIDVRTDDNILQMDD